MTVNPPIDKIDTRNYRHIDQSFSPINKKSIIFPAEKMISRKDRKKSNSFWDV